MLLSEPPARQTAPRLEASWFVDGCPLDADHAVAAIRKRHGFASRAAALRALRKARDALRAKKHPDAAALDDLPRAATPR